MGGDDWEVTAAFVVVAIMSALVGVGLGALILWLF
jgi:hypothetical protein